MKHIFLFFLLLSSLIVSAQSPQLQSTMNLMVNLLDCPTNASMTSLCLDRGLTDLGTQDGFQTFSSPSGITVRCKIANENNWKIPIIELQTPDSQKEVVKALQKSGFHKKGNSYLKGNPYTITQKTCKIIRSQSKLTDLTFTKKIYSME